jgi:hypothetical protein
MVTTSLEASKHGGGNRSAAPDETVCDTCRAPVDLTASVLMKGQRIVGCPSCDWGAGATSSHAAGSRASTTRMPRLMALD